MMFKFLKDKLKSVVKSFSKQAESDIPEETDEHTNTMQQEDVSQDIQPQSVDVYDQQLTEKQLTEQSESLDDKQDSLLTTDSIESESIPPQIEKQPKQPQHVQDSTISKKQKQQSKQEPEQQKQHKSNQDAKQDFQQQAQQPTSHSQQAQPSLKKTITDQSEEPGLDKTNQQDRASVEKKSVDKIPQTTLPKKVSEKTISNESVPKKGIWGRLTQAITTTTLKQEKFEELFFDIELALLENNVSIQVIERIRQDLHDVLVGSGVRRGTVESTVISTLRNTIDSVLTIQQPDILQSIDSKKPFVIMAVGINGSGKTTTLAKLAHWLMDKKKTCVMAACDTFRAAAIQQLSEHATRLGVRLIKHDYGADPAAVAFDAIEHAKAKGIDVVLIDTAGRLHSNTNLMDELHKVERVARPDFTIFVGESITGNDCIEQAEAFSSSVRIDGIILTKADVDEKGGTALSISYVTGKPIVFMGYGQGYDDLKPFDKQFIMDNLGL